MVVPELRRCELPVPVGHGPEVFGNGYRRSVADVKQFDVSAVSGATQAIQPT